MTDRFEISDDVRASLRDIQHGTFEPIEPNYTINIRDFNEIPLPRFMRENLPEGSRLSVTSMEIQQLGSVENATALRFSMPFGPRRASVTFD